MTNSEPPTDRAPDDAGGTAAPALAIDISGVTVTRDRRPVLDDISLQIRPGEIHLLVGKNGAGKSTLLLALLGLVPFTGDIRLHLRRPAAPPRGKLAGLLSVLPSVLPSRFPPGAIGYVPQAFTADRTLPITVAEFLALSRQRLPVCLGVGRRAGARIAQILDEVGLAGMERRRIGELSGGELRRVLIGNAIEPAPELLLCDEPTTGLDPDALAALDRTLAALRDRHGTTILMISHDRAQVRRIADRVSELSAGRLRTGSPSELELGAEPAGVAP